MRERERERERRYFNINYCNPLYNLSVKVIITNEIIFSTCEKFIEKYPFYTIWHGFFGQMTHIQCYRFAVVDCRISTFELSPTDGGTACLINRRAWRWDSSGRGFRDAWTRITNYTRARNRKTWTSPGWIIVRVCDS